MRILEWAFPFYSVNGGREVFVSDLSHKLQQMGHAVQLVTEPQALRDRQSLAQFDGPMFGIDWAALESPSESNVQRDVFTGLMTFVERFDPDVIHFHTPGGRDIPLLLAVAKQTRAVMVYTEHEYPAHRPEVSKRLREPIADQVDLVISPSASSAAATLSVIPSWAPLIRVIPNGVRTEHTVTSHSSPLQVFASGRQAPEKGFSTLLAAWSLVSARHPQAHLTLAGGGDSLPTHKRLAKEWNLEDSVSFPGWLSREKARTAVAESAFVVVPSIWEEPFGLVAVEAGVAQKPVIASRVGALAEIITHGHNGLLFEAGDIGSLFVCVNSLLSDPLWGLSLGERNRHNAIGKYSIDRCASDYEGAFEEAIWQTSKKTRTS